MSIVPFKVEFGYDTLNFNIIPISQNIGNYKVVNKLLILLF